MARWHDSHLRHYLCVAAALPAVLNAGTIMAFECGQAKSPAEKAICSDPAAKASDEAMGGAFTDLKSLLDPDQAKALLVNQRDWLAQRNEYCTTGSDAPACIKEMNDARVLLLGGKPKSGPGSSVRLIPFFVDTPGTKTAPEIHVIMYKHHGDSGPLAKTLDAAIGTILDSAKKKEEFLADKEITFERKAKIFYASDRLISIEIDGFDYVQGGAHGAVTTQMLNIDPQSGRELKITDLLDGAGRTKVINLCMDQLLREKTDRFAQAAKETAESEHVQADPVEPLSADDVKTIRKYAKPVIETLSSWRFDAEGAAILFDQDEIGAHAEGAFECNFPYAQLRRLAKASFPLPPHRS